MLAELSELTRHPSRMLASTCRREEHSRRVKRYSIVSLIMVAFGIYAFITMFPELRRYILIKRM